MEDYFEHIDDYMEGKLSSDQHALFKKEIVKNSSLKEAVSNYHDAKKLSEGFLEADIMETLSSIEFQEKEPSAKTKTPSQFKWLKILGMLLVLFLIGLKIGKNIKSKTNKEEILASYIKPIDMDATKSIDTVGMNSFEKGKYFFALNKFQESEEWLTLYLSNEKNEKALSRGFYWLGSAHLEQWEVSEAKEAWSKSDEENANKNLNILNNPKG